MESYDCEKYMLLALEQAELGLKSGEVPVGCIFLHEPSQTVLARSHNLTNQTKNATTHCEINCIREITANVSQVSDSQGKDASQDDASRVLSECVLFVTVEPCIMCAYALHLAGIRKVVFGCENDKFGGNGSIISLNKFKKDEGMGYQVEKGIMKEEAVRLLQRFYEHGNEKAPEAKRQRKVL
ncbi:hypothetical protein FGO68_gene14842 [Halteria grandinella]|uniref:CMP/dCMP-type deaminase domain-containing protein n=1 Tax=Halteria grandinella TaxID=5974 RepID=A0A8J8NBP7_HALGN|nr:hypothetical protein FGO68_gene14842 [Halteria grandinella]